MPKKKKSKTEEEQTELKIEAIYKKAIKRLIKKQAMPYAEETLGKKVTESILEDVTDMLAQFWTTSIQLTIEGACLTWIDMYDPEINDEDEYEDEDEDEDEDEKEKEKNPGKEFPKLV